MFLVKFITRRLRIGLALILGLHCGVAWCEKSVGDLQWQKRILVIDAIDAQFHTDLMQASQYFEQDLKERKLQLYIFARTGWSAIPEGAIPEDIQGYHNSKLSILIGLDGGQKARYEQDAFDFNQVFADIDRMPMRRAELNTRPTQ